MDILIPRMPVLLYSSFFLKVELVANLLLDEEMVYGPAN